MFLARTARLGLGGGGEKRCAFQGYSSWKLPLCCEISYQLEQRYCRTAGKENRFFFLFFSKFFSILENRIKPILTSSKVSSVISLTGKNCQPSQEASMFYNMNSVNCPDIYQCFPHLEAPPHKLTIHIKRQTRSLQISQVWQTNSPVLQIY